MKNKLKMLAGTAAVSMAILMAAPAMAATDAQTAAQDQSGFYVGAFGGFDWVDADAGATSVDINGSDWGVFVGYELTDLFSANNIGMTAAIEAHYAWSTGDDTAGGVTVEKDNEWGVSFRPGFTFLDTASIKPYGIVGYKRAEFDAAGGGTSGDDFDGFELGIGTEFIAMGDFGVRAEYAHTWYGSEGGVDPDEDTLRVGVAYHF